MVPVGVGADEDGASWAQDRVKPHSVNVAETRDQLEKRMDEAARKYAETHEEKYKDELLKLAHELTELTLINPCGEKHAVAPDKCALGDRSATGPGDTAQLEAAENNPDCLLALFACHWLSTSTIEATSSVCGIPLRPANLAYLTDFSMRMEATQIFHFRVRRRIKRDHSAPL